MVFVSGLAITLVAWVAVVDSHPPPSDTVPRPLLYGSGYIYPAWKGFGDGSSEALAWEQASLDGLVEMGAALTGASFNWCDIEPEQGVYNWTAADAAVTATHNKGLAMLAYMGNTPDWALDPAHQGLGFRFPPQVRVGHNICILPCACQSRHSVSRSRHRRYVAPSIPFVPGSIQPRFNASFQAWVTAVAKRYAGVVTMYEFWNEPNGCSWINDGCANGNMAASYAPWLCTWASAMRKADPGARLSVGGLDYNAGVAEGYTYARASTATVHTTLGSCSKCTVKRLLPD